MRTKKLEHLKALKDVCLRENKLLILRESKFEVCGESKTQSTRRMENTSYSIQENEIWKAQRESSQQHAHSHDYSEKAWIKYEKDILKIGASGHNQSSQKSKSKRRHFDEEEDVTYINYRNYRFNKKLARSFDRNVTDK